jgi:threonine dehydrogenase-like Zn-dependent dehydrogenase
MKQPSQVSEHRPVVAAPGRIEWLTVELPAGPPPGAVRIRSRVSLVSPGTELRLLRGEPMLRGVWEGYADLDCPTIPPFEPGYAAPTTGGPSGPIFPAGLGYNTVGDVIAVGEGVDEPAVGDRVLAMARHQSCFDLPAWEAWPVPAGVADDDAVYAYIASLGVAALRKARYAVAENVAVIGLGMVGLCAALAADACGASMLCFDVRADRREQARRALGGAVVADLAAAVEDAFRPHGADVVLEAGAGASSLALALGVCGRGGRVAVVALHPEDAGPLLAGDFNARQAELLGSGNDPYLDERAGLPRFTLGGNVGFVLSLLARRKLTFGTVPSRRFPVHDLAAAYGGLDAGMVREIGVLLDWDVA